MNKNDHIIPRPCMVKYDGTVDYYLDSINRTKKEDGTFSDILNPSYEGNAMMEFKIPKKMRKMGDFSG